MSGISPNEGYVNGGETSRQRAEYYEAVIAAAATVGLTATQQAMEDDRQYHTEAHPVD